MAVFPEQPIDLTLDQLLHRDDIWLGRSNSFNQQSVVDTGYLDLNARLLNSGWPLSTLIEICQRRFQGEWQLFLPALLSMDSGLIVLLNPPADPFSQAFIQYGVDLDRLIVIKTAEKTQFIHCFSELTRTSGCSALLGWLPGDYFTYTELRKCLLAASSGQGLYSIFRPSIAQQQNSPAHLRLFCQLTPSGLETTVFKQKGFLSQAQSKPVVIPLATKWQPALPYANLDGSLDTAEHIQRASVFNLRGSQ